MPVLEFLINKNFNFKKKIRVELDLIRHLRL